jgi:hypothetical protein
MFSGMGVMILTPVDAVSELDEITVDNPLMVPVIDQVQLTPLTDQVFELTWNEATIFFPATAGMRVPEPLR